MQPPNHSFVRGAFQDRLLRDAVFNKAEEDERMTWRGLLGAGSREREEGRASHVSKRSISIALG